MSAASIEWRLWDGRQSLGTDQVHVWILRVDVGNSRAKAARRLLDPSETDRADRFHFERDRVAYTLTRATLRMLLGDTLGCDPASVRFTYNPAGKPCIEGGPYFSVSHSGAFAVIAMAEDNLVGIDIEFMRGRRSDEDVRGYFSAIEVQALERLDERHRRAGFYSCWTRKEAYLKALGVGLPFGLDRFAVTIAPTPPALLWVDDQLAEPHRWNFSDLNLHPDYAGAIAVAAKGWNLHTWTVGDRL